MPHTGDRGLEVQDDDMDAYLGKVLADCLGGGTQVMTKGTGIPSLASALPEELARDV